MKPRIRIIFSRSNPGQILYWHMPIDLNDGPVAIYSMQWHERWWMNKGHALNKWKGTPGESI
jgi:hypothetical protein